MNKYTATTFTDYLETKLQEVSPLAASLVEPFLDWLYMASSYRNFQVTALKPFTHAMSKTSFQEGDSCGFLIELGHLGTSANRYTVPDLRLVVGNMKFGHFSADELENLDFNVRYLFGEFERHQSAARAEQWAALETHLDAYIQGHAYIPKVGDQVSTIDGSAIVGVVVKVRHQELFESDENIIVAHLHNDRLCFDGCDSRLVRKFGESRSVELRRYLDNAYPDHTVK